MEARSSKMVHALEAVRGSARDARFVTVATALLRCTADVLRWRSTGQCCCSRAPVLVLMSPWRFGGPNCLPCEMQGKP